MFVCRSLPSALAVAAVSHICRVLVVIVIVLAWFVLFVLPDMRVVGSPRGIDRLGCVGRIIHGTCRRFVSNIVSSAKLRMTSDGFRIPTEDAGFSSLASQIGDRS